MNDKGADQTVRMRRLVCAFAVHIFSRRDPTIYVDLADGDTVDRDGLLYILLVCAHEYARLIAFIEWKYANRVCELS